MGDYFSEIAGSMKEVKPTKEKRFAKVTGLHHDGETCTHVYDIGQRLTFIESYMFGEKRVYDFKDERGLRQTLFRDQFEWEDGE